MTGRLSGRSGGPVMRSVLKHPWLTIAVLGTVALLGAAIVVVSGVVPIKASSGHWRLTSALLDFAKVRSVKMRAWRVSEPALDDAALIVRGAGHYETACVSCHGSPAMPKSPVMAATTPFPPDLGDHIGRWRPRELFYIVKQGVKFTGMPAWRAQRRDDEVWAMVAFLLKLPELYAEEDRQLAGDQQQRRAPGNDLRMSERALQALDESCVRCHGIDGNGRELGAFPKLAGQRPTYLFASLLAFARGERHSGVMGPVAAGLDLETMRELARYYASSPPSSTHRMPDESTSSVNRGRDIAVRGIRAQRLPPCRHCHGPSDMPRNPIYPKLAGQYSDYLVLQLNLFKNQLRGGTPYAHLMHTVAKRLTPQQMRDVAAYYASLPNDIDAPRELYFVSETAAKD